MNLRKWWTAFRAKIIAHTTARAIGVLVGGSALAQAIPLLALPFLTRIYTPAEFSTFAVYTSAVTVLAVAACLRFELAIPLPKQDEEAASQLWLCILSATVLSLLTALAILVFLEDFARLLGDPNLRPYLLLIPLGMFTTSVLGAAQFWSTRKERFTALATARILQSGSGVVLQLGAGAAGIGVLALLGSHVISSALAAARLLTWAVKESPTLLTRASLKRIRDAFHAHDRFPKYSTLEAFANTAGIQVPIIIIAAVALGPEAGYFALVSRVVGAPINIVSSAVAQLYASRAPIEARAGTLDRYTTETIAQLAAYGLIPMLGLCIIAPPVFQLVFGREWSRAGDIVIWMSPWFFLQFLTIPVSMVIHVVGRQTTALALQLAGVCLRIGIVAAAAVWAKAWMVEAYAISGFVFYAIYLAVAVRCAGIPPRIALKAIFGHRVQTGALLLALLAAVAALIKWII